MVNFFPKNAQKFPIKTYFCRNSDWEGPELIVKFQKIPKNSLTKAHSMLWPAPNLKSTKRNQAKVDESCTTPLLRNLFAPRNFFSTANKILHLVTKFLSVLGGTDRQTDCFGPLRGGTPLGEYLSKSLEILEPVK